MDLYQLRSHIILDPAVLRQARQEGRGWSQNELARRSGITKNLIWRLEKGRPRPSFATMRELSEALLCGLSGRVFAEDPQLCRASGCEGELVWIGYRLAMRDVEGRYEMVPGAHCRCSRCGAEVDIPEKELRP